MFYKAVVEGYGQACATAEAHAEASATVWATIIATAFIRVTQGDPFKDPALRAKADGYAAAMAFGTAEVN